jgi:hypothetical protein
MKNNTTSLTAADVRETAVHPTKLVSLLALASGAAAMPQNTLADIIYTDLNLNPQTVGFGPGSAAFLFDLPGDATFGFLRTQTFTYTQPAELLTINYRTVIAGDLTGAAPAGVRADGNLFVVPQDFGAAWSQGGVGTALNAAVGWVNDFAQGQPGSGYDRKFLAWYFTDTTAPGDAEAQKRYGWAEISLSMLGYNAGGPQVTIFGYAYDTTGAKPTMGAVPEPSSGALFALGAMALGARGLRKWRQNRQPVNQA